MYVSERKRTDDGAYRTCIKRIGCAALLVATFFSGPFHRGEAFAASASDGTADLVLTGGKVVTLDAKGGVSEALAIRGNKIEAVGSAAEIARWIGSNTRVISLKGRAAIPGFIDSHTHVESTAEFESFWVDLHSPPLPAERTSKHIIEKLRARVNSVGSGGWVVGQGPFGDQIPPTYTELSEAFPNNPVVVKYGMHEYVANKKAFEIAGITKLTPDPPGGKIERGPDGEPNGKLYECFELFPISYQREELKQALSKTLREDFLKQGVTTIYELTVTPAANGVYQELHKEGKLPVRLHIGYMIYPALQPTIDLDSLLNMSVHTGLGDDWLRIGPAKLFVNGAGPGVPLIRRDQALLNNTVLRLHDAGWQLWVHAIGSEAQDMALEALETALRVKPKPDARHRIEHIGNLMDMPRFERMQKAGIIPVPTEPARPYPAADAKGSTRYPYRTLLSMGFRPPGNSDTGGSYSYQMDTITRLSLFVHREKAGGGEYHSEEAVSVVDALRIMSTYGAIAGFEENTRGTLEAGKLGDIVILSGDPLTTPPNRLKSLTVDATIIDGIVAYERPN